MQTIQKTVKLTDLCWGGGLSSCCR